MAIDDRNKRASAIQTSPSIQHLPRPDGAVAGADRRHVPWLYRAVYAEVAGAFGNNQYTLTGRAGSPVVITGRSYTGKSLTGKH